METKVIKPATEREMELNLGKFRLMNAMRLTSLGPIGCTYIPAMQELALEAQTDDEGHYYVIAFIEWDEDEGCCDMRTVGPRFIQSIKTDKDWHDVKALINIAHEYIAAANNYQKEDY